MTKARDLASASPAPSTVSATELGYLDGVTSGVQAQIDSKSATSHDHNATYEPLLPSQTGNAGKYLTTDGTTKSWGTVVAGPQMVTAKISSGTASGTYTFNNTFGTGQWIATQSHAANVTLAGQSLTTAGTTRSVSVTSPASSATINIAPIASWENNDGIPGQTTSTYYQASVANNYIYLTVSNAVIRSSDGITWTTAGNGMSETSETRVAYWNGVYVIGNYSSSAGRVFSSTDGVNWTQRIAQFAGQNGYPPYGIASAPNASSKFIAAGNAGWVYHSTNGTSWTNLGQVAFANQSRINSATSDNDSTYVAVCNGGFIGTSTDGANWTARTSNTPVTLNSVVYGNGLFVVGGNSGVILTSSNGGATWTTRTSNTSSSIVEIIYAAGQTYPWVAVTEFGSVHVSTDAITWSNAVATGSDQLYTGVYFNGKYRVFGGTSPTTGLGYYRSSSNPLGTIFSDYYVSFIGPSTVTTVA